jgi:hypothetical protein
MAGRKNNYRWGEQDSSEGSGSGYPGVCNVGIPNSERSLQKYDAYKNRTKPIWEDLHREERAKTSQQEKMVTSKQTDV